MDTPWKHHFTCCVCGPRGCGKTLFVKRFLDYLPEVCDARFACVLFYHAEWQNAYRKDFKPNGPPIEFQKSLSQMADHWSDKEKRKLFILDDLIRESSSDVILDLFTKVITIKFSHHKNISVIYVTKMYFTKVRHSANISLKTKYLVLFKNRRDRAKIHHFATHIFPEDSTFLRGAYVNATHEPRSYLFIDLSQACLDEFRFQAKIFPNDGAHVAYVFKYFKSR